MPEAIGALTLLVEGALFFCLQEPEMVGMFGRYIRSLFAGWTALMSIVSLVLVFLPSTFPDKYRWCIWCASALCFLAANFMAWKHEHSKVCALEDKLLEIENARPRIVLREPNAIHVEEIGLTRRLSGVPRTWKKVPFVKVRFVNKPQSNDPNSVATGVSARVRILDLSGNCQVDMAGRWDDTTQPSFIPFGISRTELQLVDFGIEQERGLDIAFRDTDGIFVAWNNDNYNYEDVRKPEHVLTGTEFQVEVRLLGIRINETFTFQFGSGGGSHGIVITA